MIDYPSHEDKDLFSDTIITDADADGNDGDDISTIDISVGNSRKIALHRYLTRHKIEQRQERIRLRKLLEYF